MISDFKDPAIRLFGRSIQLEPNDNVSAELSPSDDNLSVSFQSSTCHKNPADDPMNNLHPCSPSSILDHNSKQSSISSSSEDSAPQEKATILPCPRCNSLNTKFFCFNNYNLKQPRHFCKDCHRYWTAGGSMRKMSIGAGRRKNKQNNNFNQDSQNLAIAPQLPIWLGFLPVQFYTPTPEFHPTLTLGNRAGHGPETGPNPKTRNPKFQKKPDRRPDRKISGWVGPVRSGQKPELLIKKIIFYNLNLASKFNQLFSVKIQTT